MFSQAHSKPPANPELAGGLAHLVVVKAVDRSDLKDGAARDRSPFCNIRIVASVSGTLFQTYDVRCLRRDLRIDIPGIRKQLTSWLTAHFINQNIPLVIKSIHSALGSTPPNKEPAYNSGD